MKSGHRRVSLRSRVVLFVLAISVVSIGFVANAPIASAAAETDKLYPNERLNPGQVLRTWNEVLSMQTDGNLVLTDSLGSAVWWSGTSTPNSYLSMQSDGNLVIYTPTNVALWHTNTYGQFGAYLVLQNDGNVVLIRGTTPVWNSGSHIYARHDATVYEDTYCGAGACPTDRNTAYQYFSNDCANFVSQALRAGFKYQIGSPNYSSTDDRLWWDYTYPEYYPYVGLPQNSQSASVSFRLRNFLINSGYGSLQATYLGPVNSPTAVGNVYPGDVFFYDWQNDGPIDHTNMEVAVGRSTASYRTGALINSHTTNRYHIFWTLYEVNAAWKTTKVWAYRINN